MRAACRAQRVPGPQGTAAQLMAHISPAADTYNNGNLSGGERETEN